MGKVVNKELPEKALLIAFNFSANVWHVDRHVRLGSEQCASISFTFLSNYKHLFQLMGDDDG